MSAVCPVCDSPQDAGLMCHACCGRLEYALRSVPGLVDDLNVTLSKQARIGNPSGGGGLARERSPIHFGASDVADNLHNTIGTWARDLWTDSPFTSSVPIGTSSAASILLDRIDAIRRHPAVSELADEIHDAVGQARRIIDRPADRIYVGPCWVEQQNEYNEYVTCQEDLYARPGANEVACRACDAVQNVTDRRTVLLENASDQIVSVREASQYIGYFGGITVNQKTIRTWLDRGRIPTRPGRTTERHLRLGDLFIILAEKTDKTRQNA